MGNNMKLIRWIALLAVMAMVAVACASDEDAAETTTTTTTEAPVTTAPPADTGDDEPTDMPDEETTTTTTTAPPADDPEEQVDPTPEGFPLSLAIFDEPNVTNYWAYLADATVWSGYVIPSVAGLYGYAFPTYTFGPSVAADLVPPPIEIDGEHWSVTVNIRDDATWSDGLPITAHDMEFTWDTNLKYEGIGGTFTSSYPIAKEDDPATEEDERTDGVVDIEALSDKQVKITFNFDAGIAVWPIKTGGGAIFPRHYWQPIVDASDTVEDLLNVEALDAPSATGYISTQYEPGAFWRNVAIEDYWDQGARVTVYENGAISTERNGTIETFGGEPTGDVLTEYTEGPHANDVTYSIYGDQNSAVLALTDGEVDFLLNPIGLQRGLQSLILDEPSLNLVVNQSNGYRYLAFNLRKFPMSDKAFRTAVACRIDKDFMANTVLAGAAIPLDSQVPPGNAYWHSPEIIAPCAGLSEEERLDMTVSILRDGGWTWSVEPEWDADDGDVRPKGEGLTGPNGEQVGDLELLAPPSGYDPLRATYALFIEEWLTDLGFPLRAEPTGFNTIVEKISDPEVWDIYILGYGFTTTFPSHVFTLFIREQDTTINPNGSNNSGFSNDEFEELNEQYNRAKTLEDARELIRAADRLLAEEIPMIVLFSTPSLEAYRDSIEFPYTQTLDGIQQWFSGGGNANVVARN